LGVEPVPIVSFALNDLYVPFEKRKWPWSIIGHWGFEIGCFCRDFEFMNWKNDFNIWKLCVNLEVFGSFCQVIIALKYRSEESVKLYALEVSYGSNFNLLIIVEDCFNPGLAATKKKK
jgi:hypothetical protein